MESKQETKLQVMTSKEFDDSELKEIKEIFNSAGYEADVDNSSMIRKGIEIPPAIWIFIKVAAAAYAAGFFGKAGSDGWDKLKDAMKKLNKIKKNNQTPQIRLHIIVGTDEIIVGMPSDEKEFENALESLLEYLNKNPRTTGWIWFYEGKWIKR